MGLYPNKIRPHAEGFIAIRKALDTKKDKTISTDFLIELAEYVLKIIYLSTINVFKQLKRTAIVTTLCHHIFCLFRRRHTDL